MAFGVASGAMTAAVMDQLMTELNPARLRKELHKIAFDLDWVCLGCEVEALCDAGHMSIHNHAAGNAEGGAENDIGGLTGGSGDGEQLFDAGWNLAIVHLQNPLCGGDDVSGLVVIKAGGINVFAKSFRCCGGEIFHRRIFSEEAGSDHVHALIGTLGAQYGGNQELPGIGVVEGASDVGEYLIEDGQNLLKAGPLIDLGTGAFGSCDRSRHAKLAA